MLNRLYCKIYDHEEYEQVLYTTHLEKQGIALHHIEVFCKRCKALVDSYTRMEQIHDEGPCVEYE